MSSRLIELLQAVAVIVCATVSFIGVFFGGVCGAALGITLCFAMILVSNRTQLY